MYEYYQQLLESSENMDLLSMRYGRTVLRGHNRIPTEKGVDVALAVDLVYDAMRDDYDVAILVAGDQDWIRPDFRGKTKMA